MPDPDTEAAIRAAVDTLLPPTDGLPGAVDLGADRHVLEQLEFLMPGFSDMVAALLNAYAMSVRPVSFAELDAEERGRVFREMASDDSQDIRDALDAVTVFAVGGTFGDHGALDPRTGELTHPRMWEEMGYRGPSLGHPEYRNGA